MNLNYNPCKIKFSSSSFRVRVRVLSLSLSLSLISVYLRLRLANCKRLPMTSGGCQSDGHNTVCGLSAHVVCRACRWGGLDRRHPRTKCFVTACRRSENAPNKRITMNYFKPQTNQAVGLPWWSCVSNQHNWIICDRSTGIVEDFIDWLLSVLCICFVFWGCIFGGI